MMKNKDMYDLRRLKINVNHMIDGCGKRILKPIYIDLLIDDKYIVKGEMTNVEPLKWLLEWLEQE